MTNLDHIQRIRSLLKYSTNFTLWKILDREEEISNGNQFEFSITYDNPYRGVADNQTGNQTGNQTEVPNDKVLRLLKVIGEGAYTAKELMAQLSLNSSSNFRSGYLYPALAENYISRTETEHIRSANQKYYLTEKGKALIRMAQ